jgi:hypothetical protein
VRLSLISRTAAVHYSRVSRLDEIRSELEDDDLALAALEALQREMIPEWLPALNQWLVQPGDGFVRLTAALVVAEMTGLPCVPRLLEAMRYGDAEGDDNDGIGAMVTELITGSAAADCLPIIEHLSRSECADDRSDSAWLAGMVEADKAPDPLLQLSRDSTSRVRRMACEHLSSFPGDARVRDCLERCLCDPEEEVRTAASSSLREISKWNRRQGRH